MKSWLENTDLVNQEVGYSNASQDLCCSYTLNNGKHIIFKSFDMSLMEIMRKSIVLRTTIRFHAVSAERRIEENVTPNMEPKRNREEANRNCL